MKGKMVLFAVVLMMSSAMVFGSGSKAAASDARPKIRVGAMAYYSGVPIQVIMDEKLNEKYGFDIDLYIFPSGGPMAEALGAGKWDVGPIGAGGMIAVPTYNAKLIADAHYQTDVAWIFARPGSDIVKAGNTLSAYPNVIGSAETVRGKTMLGTFGNISQYMGMDYAAKLGLQLKDLNFMNMETSQIYTAFVSGNGDIACIGSPTAAFTLKDQGYPIIGGLTQQGISQQDALLASDNFYTNHKDTLVKFMEAWYTATAKLNSDKNYMIQECTKFYTGNGRTDVTEDGVRRECELSSYIDPSNYGEKKTGAWMTNLVAFMVDTGSMEPAVLDAMKRNVRTDVAEEALAKLK